MTLSTESTAKLLGDVIDIALDGFDFGTIEDLSESVVESMDEDGIFKKEMDATNPDKEVAEFLRIARERRLRKQGNCPISNDVVDSDIDSLCGIRSSMRSNFNDFESPEEDEEESDYEEYELPLNDSAEVAKSSKDLSMKRTSLTSMLQAAF